MEELICLALRYKPVIDLLISLIPIAIAVLGSYIAIQQYRTARKKLKLDLFDKRFLIFQNTKNYIGEVVCYVAATKEKQREFLVGTRGSQFVFGQEVKDYIDEVWKKSVDLEGWSLDQTTSEHSQQRAAHLKWFNDQLQKIDGKFKKYMQLSH
nr:hypothetical protein [uncultured Rhodoferax sp.]